MPHSLGNRYITPDQAPDIVIGRLPLYLRTLHILATEGRETVSSQELGDRLNITSARVRKDLSRFGEFGKRGTGYDINLLREELLEILHVDRVWDVVLVGAGALECALARWGGFTERGFRILAIFDNDPAKIGQKMGNLEIQDISRLSEMICQQDIKVGIVATPVSIAQETASMMVDSGIRVILNYTPVTLSVPCSVKVQHIDPVVHLQRMTYYLS